ncbi:hypothetical protein [Holospora obtusa]|nr:hypothetical protein [Holospora obtusa]
MTTLKNPENVPIEAVLGSIKTLLSMQDKENAENLIEEINWEKISEKINELLEFFTYIHMNVIINILLSEKNHHDLALKVVKKITDNLTDKNFICFTQSILSKSGQSKTIGELGELIGEIRGIEYITKDNMYEESSSNLEPTPSVIAKKVLDTLDFKKRINQMSSDDFIFLMDDVLSLKNDANLVKILLQSSSFTKGASQIDDDSFVKLVGFILYSGRTQDLTENALQSLNFTKRAGKLNNSDFLCLIDEIFFSGALNFTKNCLSALNLSERLSTFNDYEFSKAITCLLFSKDFPQYVEDTLQSVDFSEKFNALNHREFSETIGCILFSQKFPKLVENVLQSVHFKERIGTLNHSDFLRVMPGILFANTPTAKNYLKSSDFKERIGTFSDEEFVQFIDAILSSKNFSQSVTPVFEDLPQLATTILKSVPFLVDNALKNSPQLVESVLHTLNFKERVKKLNHYDFLGVMSKILCSDTPSFATECLKNLDLEERFNQFGDINFGETIGLMVSSENFSTLIKNILQSGNFKERANKFDNHFLHSLVREIFYSTKKINFDLTTNVLDIFDLKERINNLSSFDFIDIFKKILYSNHDDIVAYALDNLDVKKNLKTLPFFLFDSLMRDVLFPNEWTDLFSEDTQNKINYDNWRENFYNLRAEKFLHLFDFKEKIDTLSDEQRQSILTKVIRSDLYTSAMILDRLDPDCFSMKTFDANSEFYQVIYSLFTKDNKFASFDPRHQLLEEKKNILLPKLMFSEINTSLLTHSSDFISVAIKWCFDKFLKLKQYKDKRYDFENVDTTKVIKNISKFDFKKEDQDFWENASIALRILPLSSYNNEVELLLAKFRCCEDDFLKNIPKLDEIFRICAISKNPETVQAFTDKLNFNKLNELLSRENVRAEGEEDTLNWYSSASLLHSILSATNDSFAETCLKKINFFGKEFMIDEGVMLFTLFQATNAKVGDFLIKNICSSITNAPLSEKKRTEFIQDILNKKAVNEAFKTQLIKKLNWEEFSSVIEAK